MRFSVSALSVVLLGLLAGCATSTVRKAGTLASAATMEGRPAPAAEEAARTALDRFEKRRPYLAGEIFHRLDPIPIVIFVDDLFGAGEMEPFAGGPDPQVEYALRIGVAAPETPAGPVRVTIRLACRYDAVQGDADAYDAALRDFRDLLGRTLVSELRRAGESRGVEWTDSADP